MREVKLVPARGRCANFVVKQFVATIMEKAMGADVPKAYTQGSNSIVKEELLYDGGAEQQAHIRQVDLLFIHGWSCGYW